MGQTLLPSKPSSARSSASAAACSEGKPPRCTRREPRPPIRSRYAQMAWSSPPDLSVNTCPPCTIASTSGSVDVAALGADLAPSCPPEACRLLRTRACQRSPLGSQPKGRDRRPGVPAAGEPADVSRLARLVPPCVPRVSVADGGAWPPMSGRGSQPNGTLVAPLLRTCRCPGRDVASRASLRNRKVINTQYARWRSGPRAA